MVIAAVAVGSLATEEREPVSAFAVNLPDADDDGVRDEFEASMFTDVDIWDTDGDAWSDAEEFAIGSNPANVGRYPLHPPRLSANVTARGANNRIHVLAAAYYMDASNTAGAKFELGLLIGRRFRKYSSNYLAIHGESHSVAARPTGAKVAFFEISFPDTLIAPGERATFMAMMSLPGVDKPVSVRTVDVLKDAANVLLLEYPTAMMPVNPITGFPLPEGNIYLPIPTDSGTSGVPLTWTPSQLCLKKSTTVGKLGALLTQEVTEAQCITGFDGYCSPSICSGTVGEQYQTVDPLSLVGAQ